MNANISTDSNNLLHDGSDALILVKASDIMSSDPQNQLELGSDLLLSTRLNAYVANFFTTSWTHIGSIWRLDFPQTTHQLGSGLKIVQVFDNSGFMLGISSSFKINVDYLSGDIYLISSAKFDGSILITNFYY